MQPKRGSLIKSPSRRVSSKMERPWPDAHLGAESGSGEEYRKLRSQGEN